MPDPPDTPDTPPGGPRAGGAGHDARSRAPLPPAFAEQVQQVRAALSRARADLRVEEVPGPRRLAAHAVAFTASVAEPAWGHGRLVVLHDRERVAEWGGPTRVVVHAAAEVEAELGADPMLAGVAWRWLVEALARGDAETRELGGTVTRQASVRFGRLDDDDGDREDGEVEVRASWTPGPDDGLGSHATAWLELLADAAGLPPEGVSVLRPPRPRD